MAASNCEGLLLLEERLVSNNITEINLLLFIYCFDQLTNVSCYERRSDWCLNGWSSIFCRMLLLKINYRCTHLCSKGDKNKCSCWFRQCRLLHSHSRCLHSRQHWFGKSGPRSPADRSSYEYSKHASCKNLFETLFRCVCSSGFAARLPHRYSASSSSVTWQVPPLAHGLLTQPFRAVSQFLPYNRKFGLTQISCSKFSLMK